MIAFQKKTISVICYLSILFVLLMSLLIGCSRNDILNKETVTNERISEQGKNFKLYIVYEKERVYSRFEVYRSDGKVMISEECVGPIMIRQISDGIVEIDEHVGTGMSDIRYCEVERGIISQVYLVTHPVLVLDSIIVYGLNNGQKMKLVAQDIFDKTCYYEEFVVESDFYAMLTDLKARSNNEIEVTYSEINNSDGSYQEIEKTVIISLNN